MVSIKKIAAKATACLCALTLSAGIMPRIGSTGDMLATNAASTVCNPVIWSDVPDCDVIRVGDTYYMVSTTMFFSPGAPIMKSKDLVSWEICNYVYDVLDNGDVQTLKNGKHDYSHGQWAASLRYHKGTYYVFFGSYGTGKSYIYKTTDIENGTWTRSEIPGMYHDASMFFDDDGRNYLVYGGGGEIKIKEFNSEMTGFKSGGADKTLFKTNLDGLAGEGSHIQKIGDYYYVFVIAWPSGSGRIELAYRSKDILGSYEGKTVLNSGLGTYGSGVAQGGIVDTPDGKWYGLLFQDHGSVGRIPVLVPVTWQDNWPMMGVNGKAPVTFTIDGDMTGTALAKSDDFSYSSNKLALEWQWNHNPDNSAWSVTDRPGWLRLTNKTNAKSIIHARNTLTMRTEGPSCSSCIKLDTSGMKPGDYAGLSAFQFKYGNVGVRVEDNGAKKVYMAENGGYGGNILESSDKIIEQVDMRGDEVYLKADFKFNNVDGNFNVSNNIDKVNFFYSFNGSDWTKIGSELSMSYDLKMFTGYRSGIYSYSTKTTGGYADIDFFEYERAEWNAPVIVEPDENGYYFHDEFEGSSCKWSGRGSAKVSTSSDISYAGNESLYVSGRENTWNGAIRNLGAGFNSGEEYSFSVNAAYSDGPDTRDFKLTLEYTNSDGDTTWDEIASGTTASGEWIQLANPNYKLPSGSNYKIIVETTDDTLEDFYIDEAIGAVAGTQIDGPGQPDIKPALLGDADMDGKITAFDFVIARKAYLGEITDKSVLRNLDVDQSGKIEVNDIVLLHSFIIGRIKEFPVEA